MDTTQKNREETAQRRPRQTAQEAAPPPSAQQNNGAVRSAEEQRASSRQRQPQAEPRARQAEPSQKQAAPKKKAAPEKKPKARKASVFAKAPAKQEPVKKKKPAPAKKAEAPKKKKAAPKAEEEDISTKKRAYGNSKPKKNAVTDIVQKSQARKAAKIAQQSKKRPKQPTPAVIYTQPAAFNRNRLLMQLVTAAAIVLALVMGVSVFFKVEHITVSGAEVYSEWAIKEASGLEGGENLLTFSRPRAGALIKANLPYVDTVRFGIKLPDTVNIIVEEDQVVYAIKDSTGTWWLMNSDGRVVEMGNNSKASSHTQVLGVTLDAPVVDEKGIATEAAPMETDDSGEIIPVTVTGAQRLTAALQILRALEDNDIVGEAASVDVTRLEDIILWYGSRYQVNLGDSTRLDYKIACMNDVILQMSDYQSGILDISFTIWPDRVAYTPFS